MEVFGGKFLLLEYFLFRVALCSTHGNLIATKPAGSVSHSYGLSVTIDNRRVDRSAIHYDDGDRLARFRRQSLSVPIDRVASLNRRNFPRVAG